MKKKIALILFSSFVITGSAFADDFSYMDPVDFTGEAFFVPASSTTTTSSTPIKNNGSSSETMLPLKKLRLQIQEKIKYRDAVNSELAPTAKDLYESETANLAKAFILFCHIANFSHSFIKLFVVFGS